MSEQYIRYESRLYVMIYRLCNEDVTKNGTALHYRRHGEAISLRARRELVKYCNNFALCEMEELEYPKTIIRYKLSISVLEYGFILGIS
jgi:hypothetical protein